MTDRDIMSQALDALEAVMYGPEEEGVDYASNAIDALRERLAQPEPPPECQTQNEKTAFTFGWWKAMETQRLAQPEQEQKPPVKTYCGGKPNYCIPEAEIYKREWVGLTDKDIEDVWSDETLGRYALCYAIEAKLREKNA